MIASEWLGPSVVSIKKMSARRSVFPPRRNIRAMEALGSEKSLPPRASVTIDLRRKQVQSAPDAQGRVIDVQFAESRNRFYRRVDQAEQLVEITRLFESSCPS
jgi:hypothetical protein